MPRTAVRPTSGQLDLMFEVETWWSTIAPPVPVPARSCPEPLSGLEVLLVTYGGPSAALETVRAGGVTHLAPMHGQDALCGLGLGLDVVPAAGEAVSCGRCALPPEAD